MEQLNAVFNCHEESSACCNAAPAQRRVIKLSCVALNCAFFFCCISYTVKPSDDGGVKVVKRTERRVLSLHAGLIKENYKVVTLDASLHQEKGLLDGLTMSHNPTFTLVFAVTLR